MSTYDVDILRRIEDKVLNDESLARGANVMGKLSAEDSEIRTYLKDRCILITGCTGFLGQVLLEKLLRTCHEIRAVFVLIRKKKNETIEDRLNKMFDDVLFSELKKSHRNFRKKVVPIAGDVDELGLGLSEEDVARVHADVSVVFHMAAMVRFDETLKTAVRTNVRGTAEVLRIARGCPKLVSVLYCSTAYSQCDKIIKLEEKYYDAPYDPIDLINLVENTDDAKLVEMTPKLLGLFPNTYVYSKACAEELVRRQAATMPVCLFRPSVVVPTYREPLGGWTNSLNGPQGMVTGAGVGLVHVMHADSKCTTDMVPVDLVANAAIACAWQNGVVGIVHEPTVYNYVSSPQNAITIGQMVKICELSGLDMPTMEAIWYYSFTVTTNWYLFAAMTLVMHFIPALLIDAASVILGKKPRLLKLYKQIWTYNQKMCYFAMESWRFSNDRTLQLWDKMTGADQEMFNFNAASFEWERYFDIMIMGLRVYLVKDPSSTLPQARIRWRRLYYIHRTVQVLGIALMCWMLYSFVLPIVTYIF